MRVAIITEGIYGTGYGHLTRCLSISQAFEEKGIVPLFIANCDEEGKKFIPNVNLLQINWQKNIAELLRHIQGFDIAIVDSYLAPIEIYEQIYESVKKAVYLDDYIRLDYPPGIIVNGTINADSLPYKKNKIHEFLLGVDYIPLRKEYWDTETPERKKSDVKNVLITFGAQDFRNLTTKVLSFLDKKFPSLNYHVVVSEFFEPKLNKDNIFYYHTLSAEEMLQVMFNTDVAITAAGQTTYELTRLGIPMIAIGVAENQKNNINGWLKNNIIKDELWFDDYLLLDKLAENIFMIYNNFPNCVINGQGARRIANTIIDSGKDIVPGIVLREAKFDDAQIIFDLSNDEAVRINSINKNLIEWENHKKWLKLRLSDNNYKIFLFFFENSFIGQVKFEIKSKIAIISISIHPDFRGKGISSIVLKMAIEYFLRMNDAINDIVALIRPENQSSIKIFSKAGFVYKENELINQEHFLKYTYGV